jgi:hypothetical protein
MHIDDVDGESVARVASPENIKLATSVAAGIWTDTHFSLTHAEKVGITKLDLEREVLARIISLCSHGPKVDVRFADDESFM